MGKRLFAAVKINPDVRFVQHLHTLQNKMLRDHIKWVEPENIHITLKFFGDTAPEAIPAISNALKMACENFGSFNVCISQLGIFGSRHQPRVIWMNIEPRETLISLEQRITNQLSPLGYVKDRQNFVPHLTLGRINKIFDLDYFQETLENHRQMLHFKQQVDSVILYESVLQKSGPVYRVVEGYGLEGK